jgi:hypothetical protein
VVVAFAVRDEEPMCEIDKAVKVLDVAHRRPGRNPTQETDFRLVDVAGSGQIPLIEDRVADRSGWVEAQAPGRFVGVPIWAEQVGAEMPDKTVFGGRWHERNVVNAPAHRRPG